MKVFVHPSVGVALRRELPNADEFAITGKDEDGNRGHDDGQTHEQNEASHDEEPPRERSPIQ
jgi:hypothetical protein